MATGRLRLALKKLAHRNWIELREEWIEYLPLVEFAQEYPSPTLWQLVDLLESFGPIEDQSVIGTVHGVREAIFREAVVLARKFTHCRSLMQIAATEGRSTWASIAAYEACFYGAKAFCYLLGIASIGRDSPFYLDAFFEATPKSKKKLAEDRFDMKLHKLPERLTHAMLWGLTERLTNTTTFEGDLSELKVQLRAINWEQFSNFRNTLLYDGAFWTKLDVYEECDLIKLVSDISIYRATSGGSFNAVPFAKEYFSCMRLFGSALGLMFSDLARLAPALAVEATALQI